MITFLISILIGTLTSSSCVLSMSTTDQMSISTYRDYFKLSPIEVNLCLLNGADVNYQPDPESPTLLMRSMTRNLTHHTRMLLRNKACINTEVRGKTALYWAIHSENSAERKVALLLKYKHTNLYIEDAFETGNFAITARLIKEVADPLPYVKNAIPKQQFNLIRLFLRLCPNADYSPIMRDTVRNIIDQPFCIKHQTLFQILCDHHIFSPHALDLARYIKNLTNTADKDNSTNIEPEPILLASDKKILYTRELDKQLKNIIVKLAALEQLKTSIT